MKKFTDKINESVDENKVPSSYEFLEDLLSNELEDTSFDSICGFMRKFAKLHVEAALKEASEKASLTDFAYEFLQEGAPDAIDKDTILNSYSLENIK
jgi:hypothetical protein